MACGTIEHIVYTGADNIFTLLLSSQTPDGITTPVDLVSINTMTLELLGQPTITVNRNAANAAIDWWDEALNTGEVNFQLGPWAQSNSIPAGNYSCQLISYDLVNTNGVVWTSHAVDQFWVGIR